jgi:hypothetical protein
VAKDAPFIKKHIPRLDIIMPISAGVLIIISFGVVFTQVFTVLQGFSPMYSGGIASFGFPFFSYLVLIPLSLLYSAFLIFVYYHLFKLYAPNDAVLYTIISALGFSFIFIFIIRNKKPVIEDINRETETQKTLN